MNIISIGGADAVTIDGSNWILYVYDNFDCPTDDPQEFFEIEMPDIRFGDWNKETGLRHSPLIASYHYNEIHAIGNVLLDAVEQYAGACPYPFADKYELWLLDEQTSEPLALLDSVCKKTEIQPPRRITWEAGFRCKHEFLKEFSSTDKSLSSAADVLSTMVNQRAGKQPAAQWFHRDRFDYGNGLNGVNLQTHLVNRELSARLFPKMLVQQQWRHNSDETLIDAFINWLSPCLLVLDFLRDSQREVLERSARQHALLVDKMYPLYPKVIDQQSIHAARVEARMRKTVTPKEKSCCSPLDSLC